MKEFSFVIKDPSGIHARPAGQLVKIASSYPCSIKIKKDEKEADAKRIFAVMSLAAKQGESIRFVFDGEKENDAMIELKEFCENNL